MAEYMATEQTDPYHTNSQNVMTCVQWQCSQTSSDLIYDKCWWSGQNTVLTQWKGKEKSWVKWTIQPVHQFALWMLSIGLFVTLTQSSLCLPFSWKFSAHHKEIFFKSSNWAPEPSLFWMLMLDNLPTISQWLNSMDDPSFYTILTFFIERIL